MKQRSTTTTLAVLAGSITGLALPTAATPQGITSEAPMMRGDTPNSSSGWTTEPLFTVSETLGDYLPVGILDGIGAFASDVPDTVDVLINHELSEGNGYPYELRNGTMLTGARVSRFQIKRTIVNGVATVSFRRSGPAFDKIYDRSGLAVTDPAQVNEDGNAIDGIARLCSSQGVAAGSYGFADDVYLSGEETGIAFHPHGGSLWALDVHDNTLWAVPAAGRMAWENVTPLETGDDDTIALLCGDDSQSAPLYLYIGEKNAAGDNSFLDRNGLKVGSLYAWKADNGDLTPEEFNGLNESRRGTFVPVTVQDLAMAGMPGYDAAGYADVDTLQNEADALGCHSFSRPEDVATNPLDGTQAVLASTGRGGLFPSDNWGITYVVDVDFDALAALLVIIHDGDDLPVPDEGIRSPDNLDWADDGKIYIQEDRSTSPSSLFGMISGADASIWKLDPITRDFERIAEMDDTAVAPADATNDCAGVLGCWESSGILDVTNLFNTLPDERLFLITVQAHGIEDGSIGGNALLDEGGQILFLSKIGD